MGFYGKIRFGIVAGVFAILAIGTTVAIPIVLRIGGAALNMFFSTKNYITISDEGDSGETFFNPHHDYLKGNAKYDASTPEKLFADDNEVIYQTELEGATLLWNKNNALPLSGNEYLNLLSHSSIDYVRGGSGSGYVITVRSNDNGISTSTTMKDAFSQKGFSVNNTLWDFYSSGDGSKYKRTSPEGECTQWRQWRVNEVPWNVYTTDVKNSFANPGKKSVAIITISRTGGEYSDLHYNYSGNNDFIGGNALNQFENTPEDNGYLGLTDEETALLDNIKSLKESNVFEKVVLLLNTGNPIRFKDLMPYQETLDACMWIGQPGSYGINAVVDLLKGSDKNGKPVAPSGHLPDTFMYDLNSAPSTENDGNYVYKGDLAAMGLYDPSNNYYNTYSVYQEGIYIGYRYYETRYEDALLGKGNASSTAGAVASSSNWKYEEEVAFPFGYGDTYASFAFSDFQVAKTPEGDFEASVKVTNTGSIPGKEAVQVYLQKPYTAYDVQNHIEKSAVELAGYAKTGEIPVGGSEDVTISIPREYFKTYDGYGEKTYIIEEGMYYIGLGENAHDALNRIIEKKDPTLSESTTSKVFGNYEKHNSPTATLSANDSVFAFHFDKDVETYRRSTQTGEIITNQLDFGDLNLYENAGTNSTVYLSRNDWNGTYPSKQDLQMTEGLAKDLTPDVEPESTGEFPNYSTFASGSTRPNVAAGDVVALQFAEAPLYPERYKGDNIVYEDGKGYVEHWTSMWNRLLDQMSFEEQALMAANAYHQIFGASSINLPSSKQENGPVGITKRGDKNMGIPDQKIAYYNYVSYPSAQVVAASFNDELSQKVGEEKSEDMYFLGYNGIYGPGINMHRSPYSGRAYEYPSEDPLLSGQIEWFESHGIESNGCLAYAKHFVMNDSETNRAHVGVWNYEQAVREIYCRPFEICFAEGGAHATMNGFNRIGAKWNGACVEMMTNILRNEWGWDGVNISDWRNPNQNSMSYVQGIMAGTNSFDGNDDASAYAPYRNNATVCRALRESTKCIILNVARTHAMNGMSLDSKVIPVTPWWEATLYVVRNVFWAVFAFAMVGLALSIAIPLINKNKEEPSPRPLNIYKEGSKRRFFIDFNKRWKIISVSGAAVIISAVVLGTVLPITLAKPVEVRKDEIQVVIPIHENVYPYDDGVNVQNRFEIEKAKLSGGTEIEDASYSDGKAYELTQNGTASISFISDSQYRIEVHLGILGFAEETSLGSVIGITANGKEVSLDKSTLPVDSANEIQDCAFFIPIDIGTNNLIITAKQTVTIDYLDLNTSASIFDVTNE